MSRPSGRRVGAVVASVAAVGAVVAGVLIFGPTSAGPAGSTASRSTPPDRLAAEAPCGQTKIGGDQADQRAIRAFGAVAAVDCVTTTRGYPGDGVWQVLIRQVLPRADLDRLISELTRPDSGHPRAGQFCSAVGYLPLGVLLVDAARHYLHPEFPHDACSAPVPPTIAQDIARLPWRTVSVTKLSHLETQPAIDSGCSQQYKNVIQIDASELGNDPGTPVFGAAADKPVKVCIYDTGTDPLGARFERGLTLTGDRASQLRAALAGPGSSGRCDPQPRFAAVDIANSYVYVELGGCWRVERADTNPPTVGRADPTTLKALLGLR